MITENSCNLQCVAPWINQQEQWGETYEMYKTVPLVREGET